MPLMHEHKWFHFVNSYRMPSDTLSEIIRCSHNLRNEPILYISKSIVNIFEKKLSFRYQSAKNTKRGLCNFQTSSRSVQRKIDMMFAIFTISP